MLFTVLLGKLKDDTRLVLFLSKLLGTSAVLILFWSFPPCYPWSGWCCRCVRGRGGSEVRDIRYVRGRTGRANARPAHWKSMWNKRGLLLLHYWCCLPVLSLLVTGGKIPKGVGECDAKSSISGLGAGYSYLRLVSQPPRSRIISSFAMRSETGSRGHVDAAVDAAVAFVTSLDSVVSSATEWRRGSRRASTLGVDSPLVHPFYSKKVFTIWYVAEKK